MIIEVFCKFMLAALVALLSLTEEPAPKEKEITAEPAVEPVASDYIRVEDSELQQLDVDEIKAIRQETIEQNRIQNKKQEATNASEETAHVDNKQDVEQPVVEENGILNFDNYFPFIDGDANLNSDDAVQYYVDSNYVVRWGGDYFHHNTKSFLKQFWKLSYGKQVQIGGIVYTCYGVEHGREGNDGGILTDNGYDVFCDSAVEIVTCDGPYGTTKRWIAHLG